LKLKRKNLQHLQRYEVFRKYYERLDKKRTLENYVQMPIQDFEELLKIIKHNLKKIQELKATL
jgi:hypothetical protein